MKLKILFLLSMFCGNIALIASTPAIKYQNGIYLRNNTQHALAVTTFFILNADTALRQVSSIVEPDEFQGFYADKPCTLHNWTLEKIKASIIHDNPKSPANIQQHLSTDTIENFTPTIYQANNKESDELITYVITKRNNDLAITIDRDTTTT